MSVNFSIGQSNIMNVHRINQSITARNGNRGSAQLSKAERRDSVTISPGGKRNHLLEQLIKQKATITDQKNSLISSTLENGGTLDTIKAQLENYDEQMKSVDEQIAELMAKETEKQTEALKKQEESTPKTEEEIQSKRLSNITSLSSDLEQAKVISSVQTQVDGGARALKAEIELDKSRASTPGATELIAKKEATLFDVQEKSLDLTSQISEKISDINENTNNVNKPQVIAPSEETELGEVTSAYTQFSADKPSTVGAEDINAEKTLEEKTVSE